MNLLNSRIDYNWQALEVLPTRLSKSSTVITVDPAYERVSAFKLIDLITLNPASFLKKDSFYLKLNGKMGSKAGIPKRYTYIHVTNIIDDDYYSELTPGELYEEQQKKYKLVFSRVNTKPNGNENISFRTCVKKDPEILYTMYSIKKPKQSDHVIRQLFATPSDITIDMKEDLKEICMTEMSPWEFIDCLLLAGYNNFVVPLGQKSIIGYVRVEADLTRYNLDALRDALSTYRSNKNKSRLLI